MVKSAFIITCGFILGALVIENKDYFTHNIPIPVASLPDGGIYDGDLNKGVFHGKGRIVWPNKDYYEGKFFDGVFQGRGVLQTAHFLYDGEFELGHATGKGVIQYANSDRYQGDVQFALPHGHGVLETVGTVYTGEFTAGQYHGEGELLDARGSRYVGHFFEGNFHGKGVYIQLNEENSDSSAVAWAASDTLSNKAAGTELVPDEQGIIAAVGMSYRGDFVHGDFTGDGIWLDGDKRYEGQFINWLFHGKGEYRDADGHYIGEFKKGVFDGRGVYHRHTGERYEGDFVAGLYDGRGLHTSAEGDSYRGGFAKGLRHGKGTLDYAEALDGINKVVGTWDYGRLVESNHPDLLVDEEAIAEHALYQQPVLLNEHLSLVNGHNPDAIDLYFVGVAGDAGQDVFRREMAYVQSQFSALYGTNGRSITLVNSPKDYTSRPLATVTSIQKTLAHVAAKMDADNDILFLYLSSHGSRNFEFELSQPGLALPPLGAEALGEMLKALPVRHKVVVISACFSGGFILPLKDSSTMVITAAEADKASFGCHDRATMTYFGEAFFKDALHQSDSFVAAFDRARDIVKGREAKEGFEYSNPLIFKPKAIVEHLQKWREQRRGNQLKTAIQ